MGLMKIQTKHVTEKRFSLSVNLQDKKEKHDPDLEAMKKREFPQDVIEELVEQYKTKDWLDCTVYRSLEHNLNAFLRTINPEAVVDIKFHVSYDGEGYTTNQALVVYKVIIG